MSMSKKDFIKLADALRAQKPQPNWSKNKMVQWRLDVNAISDVCLSQNPNFKPSRWLDYINGECGPNGGKI